MSEKRFKLDWSQRVGTHFVLDSHNDKRIDFYSDVVDLLNKQQATIEEQNKGIKGLEEKIQRIYVNVCSAMSEVIDDE